MDFGTRINEARNQANTSMNTYNEYAKQAQAKQGEFDTALNNYGNTKYGDRLDSATNKYLNTEDMQKSRNTYQQARAAVDSLNATMNQLPDTITGAFRSNGLMMNDAQRNRALQSSYNNYNRALNNASNTYNTASEMYDKDRDVGLRLALQQAQGEDAAEWNRVGALQQAWNSLLNQRNTAYSQNIQDRGLLANQYGARDDWELKQQQMALERWKEQQANARAAADRNAQFGLQKYLMDRQDASSQKNRDFQNALAKEQRRAGLIADANASQNRARQAMNSLPRYHSGNFLKDYGASIGTYGPLAMIGKGWGW